MSNDLSYTVPSEFAEFTLEDRRKLDEVHKAITEIRDTIMNLAPMLESNPLLRMLAKRSS